MADNFVAHVCSFDVLVESCGGRKQIIPPAEQAAGGVYFWSWMDGWNGEQSNLQQDKAIYRIEIGKSKVSIFLTTLVFEARIPRSKFGVRLCRNNFRSRGITRVSQDLSLVKLFNTTSSGDVSGVTWELKASIFITIR